MDLLDSFDAFSADRLLLVAGAVVLFALCGGLLVMWWGGRG